MTALGEQLAANGFFNTAAIATTAITANQVYRDGNGQVRVAGCSRALVADQLGGAVSEVAALALRDNYTMSQPRGASTNKY